MAARKLEENLKKTCSPVVDFLAKAKARLAPVAPPQKKRSAGS
jgi:hypothetical protein